MEKRAILPIPPVYRVDRTNRLSERDVLRRDDTLYLGEFVPYVLRQAHSLSGIDDFARHVFGILSFQSRVYTSHKVTHVLTVL